MTASGTDLYLKLVGEQVKVVETLDKVVARLEKLERSTEQVNKKAKTMGEKMSVAFGKAGKAAQEFSQKVVKIGVTMGAAGLVASIYKSIAAASSFETKMAEVSTLLGSKAGPKIEKFDKAVRDLAKTTSASANELASGLYQVISAGTKGTEKAAGAMNLLEAANKVAVAGVSDTFSAVDVLTTALNAYGKSADEASVFSDILFSTVKLGKINFSQLSSSIGMVTSSAAGAGVSFEEVNAAIAAMTALGVPAERAITGMNGIIRVAAKGTKELDAAIKKKLGTTTSDILETRGLTGILEALQEVTGGSVIAMQKLGIEQEAIQGLSVLAGTGIDKFKTSLLEMQNATGATEEAYKKMSQTFEFQSKKFRNVVNEVFIEIGNQILPFLIEKLEGIAKWVQDHENDIKEFVVSATEAIIGFGEFVLDNGATIAKLFVAIWLTSLGPIGQVAAAIGVILEGLRQLFEWMGPGGKGDAVIAGLRALGIISGPVKDVRTEKDFEWGEDEELGGISGEELFGFRKPKGKKPKLKGLSGKRKVRKEPIDLGEGGFSGMSAFAFGFEYIQEMIESGVKKAREEYLGHLAETERGVGFKGEEAKQAYKDMRAAWEQMAYEKWVKPMEEPSFWEQVAIGFREAIGKKLLDVALNVGETILKPFDQIGNLLGMALGGINVADIKAQTAQMVGFWEALAENIGPVLDYLVDEGIPIILDAFIDNIPDIIDAITEHVPDIIEAFIKRIPEIALALAEAVVMAIGNLFGIGGGPSVGGALTGMGAGAGIGAAVGSIIPGVGTGIGAAIGTGIGFLASLFHEGGVVDRFGENVTMFKNAVKAHSGMFVGSRLGSQDVPIIAKVGEGIIRSEVTAALGGKPAIDAINSGRGLGGDTHIHVHAEHYFAETAAEVVDGLMRQMARKGRGLVYGMTTGKQMPGFESRR